MERRLSLIINQDVPLYSSKITFTPLADGLDFERRCDDINKSVRLSSVPDVNKILEKHYYRLSTKSRIALGILRGYYSNDEPDPAA